MGVWGWGVGKEEKESTHKNHKTEEAMWGLQEQEVFDACMTTAQLIAGS